MMNEHVGWGGTWIDGFGHTKSGVEHGFPDGLLPVLDGLVVWTRLWFGSPAKRASFWSENPEIAEYSD